MLFENAIFNPAAVGDSRTAAVLFRAADRVVEKLRAVDLLAAAIDEAEPKFLATLAQALGPDVAAADLRELIELSYPSPATPGAFDGRPNRFTPEALEGIKQFDAELAAGGPSRELALHRLFACVLPKMSAAERDALPVLDADKAADCFRRQAELAHAPPPALFDADTRRLRSEEFQESAWTVLEYSAARAADLGYDRILPPHLLLATLGETEGIAESLVRLQATPSLGPGRVQEVVADAFRLGDRRSQRPELARDSFAESSIEVLEAAGRTAQQWNADRIGTLHLMAALLELMPPRLATVLSGHPLELNLERMKEHLSQRLSEAGREIERDVPFRLGPSLPRSEDLTNRARQGELNDLYVRDRATGPLQEKAAKKYADRIDSVVRALYRRKNNHVLLTGLPGVGKTSLLRDLARRAAACEIPFLKRKRFVWMDCRDVLPEDSRKTLEAILAAVSGRTDVVLCLDGLGPLLRSENGGNNKVTLRAALAEQAAQIIGVLAQQDFDDLLASDPEVLDFFTRVDVLEPERDEALRIVRQASERFKKAFKLEIEDRAIDRAVVLSSNYILNERLPRKAVKVLERACEELDFERTQRGAARKRVGASDIERVVSRISGVPESTLARKADDVDYEAEIGREVVGQKDAVRSVADQIELIKGGLTSPKKPASVMLFAGLTGTGKTELAKAVAKRYSASKQLKVYTMGNFTEAHSVSGIIGVPAGYVGHDQGGRLINDLNSDPYSVFLLDEVEKAHPDIWKPFLNLFDEGWITDQRGVKAFADKSIFILTSNAGQDTISRMTGEGKSIEAIIEEVRRELPGVKNSRGENIFSPEFLARIKQIIIFRPLTRDAMEGICRNMVERRRSDWKSDKEKTLTVPEELIQHVAREADRLNIAAGNKEGGRVVDKLLSELVDLRIQKEGKKRNSEYQECSLVELDFFPPLQQSSPPTIHVHFRIERPPAPPEAAGAVANSLRQDLARVESDAAWPARALGGRLAELQGRIDAWKKGTDGNGADPLPAPLLEQFQRTCSLVEQASRQSAADIARQIESLILELEALRQSAGSMQATTDGTGHPEEEK